MVCIYFTTVFVPVCIPGCTVCMARNYTRPNLGFWAPTASNFALLRNKHQNARVSSLSTIRPGTNGRGAPGLTPGLKSRRCARTFSMRFGSWRWPLLSHVNQLRYPGKRTYGPGVSRRPASFRKRNKTSRMSGPGSATNPAATCCGQMTARLAQ